MTTIIPARYHRQGLINGWEQDKLKKSSVAIIGADLLGQSVIIPLTALGVGNIRVIGPNKKNVYFLDFKTKTECDFGQEVVQKINPDVDLVQTRAILANIASSYFLKHVDVVVDATNNPISKLIAANYCTSNHIPFFSASCDEYFGRLIMPKSIDELDGRVMMCDMACGEQGEITSVVLGGFIAEEIKKVIMGEKQLLSNPIYYNRTNSNRFSFERLPNEKKETDFTKYHVLMIGAGALGNFVGLLLAKSGIGMIDIMDDDVIEETNLNRQILFYDSVGENKADVLAAKLKKIAKTKVTAINKRFDADTMLQNKYDAIFDCVDSFDARVVINDFAVKNNIPLISGGTSYDAGQVAVYSPGQTASIDDLLKLREFAKKGRDIRQEGCVYAPNPSVIMTNQIIAGIMVGEAYNLFDKSYEKLINGILKYGANLESRIGINRLTKIVGTKK